ncbi:MAG: hypothetical protein QNJ92_14475 [Alphaproteobacteria bacterium]|nr:hypothetical protein [Alphaproteobacteria bacterium]
MQAVVSGGLKAPSRSELGAVVLAGAVALVAWEIYAQGVSPAVFGIKLEPAGLVKALFANFLGFQGIETWVAQNIHFLTGLVFYPLGYLVITRYFVSVNTWVDGLAYGLATWVFALGICAPLAGFPLMLGWAPITWTSAVGHAIYGLAVALMFQNANRAR